MRVLGKLQISTMKRITIGAEACILIGLALEQMHGFDGKTHTTKEALDWLLRDSAEYGSPVVGSWARSLWPDSPETKEWQRKNAVDAASEHDTAKAFGVAFASKMSVAGGGRDQGDHSDAS